eukprot:5800671-Prymnesium_polylepis.1
MLLTSVLVGTYGLAARAWLSGGRNTDQPLIIGGLGGSAMAMGGSLQLPLLPLDGHRWLLPGDSHHVREPDASARALLECAVESHHGCCGQLITRENGAVVGVCGLLEVVRGEDAWRLDCVGRVRLDEAWQDARNFVVSSVELHTDNEEDASEEEEDIARSLAAALSSDEQQQKTNALRAAARSDAERAAARAVAASAEASGVSQEAVVREATELLRNLDGEIHRT